MHFLYIVEILRWSHFFIYRLNIDLTILLYLYLIQEDTFRVNDQTKNGISTLKKTMYHEGHQQLSMTIIAILTTTLDLHNEDNSPSFFHNHIWHTSKLSGDPQFLSLASECFFFHYRQREDSQPPSCVVCGPVVNITFISSLKKKT